MNIKEQEVKEAIQKELKQLKVSLEEIKNLNLPSEFQQKILSLFQKELRDLEVYAEENNLL